MPCSFLSFRILTLHSHVGHEAVTKGSLKVGNCRRTVLQEQSFAPAAVADVLQGVEVPENNDDTVNNFKKDADDWAEIDQSMVRKYRPQKMVEVRGKRHVTLPSL